MLEFLLKSIFLRQNSKPLDWKTIRAKNKSQFIYIPITDPIYAWWHIKAYRQSIKLVCCHSWSPTMLTDVLIEDIPIPCRRWLWGNDASSQNETWHVTLNGPMDNDVASKTWLHFNFPLHFLLFDCLLGVFRPTRNFFIHLEMSPMPLKGCKFWPMLGTYGRS